MKFLRSQVVPIFCSICSLTGFFSKKEIRLGGASLINLSDCSGTCFMIRRRKDLPRQGNRKLENYIALLQLRLGDVKMTTTIKMIAGLHDRTMLLIPFI